MYAYKRKKAFFEIPYQLDTIDAVLEARNVNFLDIGSTNYNKILSFAKSTPLNNPPAKTLAKSYVEKTFYVVKKQRIKKMETEYGLALNMQAVDQFSLIEERVPSLLDLIDYADIDHFLGFVNGIYIENGIKSSGHSYAKEFFKLRELIRKELRVLIKSGRTKIELNNLKKIIVILALHENDDILAAIRLVKSNSDDILYQNTVTEFLFARLEKYLQRLIFNGQDIIQNIREKFFSKISKLGMPPNCNMTLYSLFKRNSKIEEINDILNKITSLSMRLPIEDRIKFKLADYIKSIKNDLNCAKTLFQTLFLTNEIKGVHSLYKTRNILRSKISYREFIRDIYTHGKTIKFYCVKDYLLVVKDIFSSDCSGNIGLNQLRCPNFFVIRVFHNNKYSGNIYALDFSEHGYLLIDRIQVPKAFNIAGYNFFQRLSEVFQEMFYGLEWKYVLLPPKVVSNHQSIQQLYHAYRKKLLKIKITFNSDYKNYFESLKNNREYYIFCEKE